MFTTVSSTNAITTGQWVVNPSDDTKEIYTNGDNKDKYYNPKKKVSEERAFELLNQGLVSKITKSKNDKWIYYFNKIEQDGYTSVSSPNVLFPLDSSDLEVQTELNEDTEKYARKHMISGRITKFKMNESEIYFTFSSEEFLKNSKYYVKPTFKCAYLVYSNDETTLEVFGQHWQYSGKTYVVPSNIEHVNEFKDFCKGKKFSYVNKLEDKFAEAINRDLIQDAIDIMDLDKIIIKTNNPVVLSMFESVYKIYEDIHYVVGFSNVITNPKIILGLYSRIIIGNINWINCVKNTIKQRANIHGLKDDSVSFWYHGEEILLFNITHGKGYNGRKSPNDPDYDEDRDDNIVGAQREYQNKYRKLPEHTYYNFVGTPEFKDIEEAQGTDFPDFEKEHEHYLRIVEYKFNRKTKKFSGDFRYIYDVDE